MDTAKLALFSDAQYGDKDARMARDYRASADKLRIYGEEFAREDVDFAVHLGDLVDCPRDPANGMRAAARMLDILSSFHCPVLHVLGNHDVDSAPRDWLHPRMGFADAGYRSFDAGPVHFVVLDSNYGADGAPYTMETCRWDAAHIGPEQLAWLKGDIVRTDRRYLVVLVHALLEGTEKDPHVIRDAADVRAVLEGANRRALVFQGHQHKGGYSQRSGIVYHTLRATVNAGELCWYTVQLGQRIRVDTHWIVQPR